MRKKLLYVSASVLLLASCATQKPLYTWGKYEITSYNYLKNTNDKSTKELIKTFQNIIERQKGSRGVVPPGIYADYGFVLLQANRVEEGKAMLTREISVYPESKVFIDRILKIVER